MPVGFAKEMIFDASKYWKLDSSVLPARYFMSYLQLPFTLYSEQS